MGLAETRSSSAKGRSAPLITRLQVYEPKYHSDHGVPFSVSPCKNFKKFLLRRKVYFSEYRTYSVYFYERLGYCSDICLLLLKSNFSRWVVQSDLDVVHSGPKVSSCRP